MFWFQVLLPFYVSCVGNNVKKRGKRWVRNATRNMFKCWLC